MTFVLQLIKLRFCRVISRRDDIRVEGSPVLFCTRSGNVSHFSFIAVLAKWSSWTPQSLTLEILVLLAYFLCQTGCHGNTVIHTLNSLFYKHFQEISIDLEFIFREFRIQRITLTPWLKESGGLMHKGSPIITIMSRINLIPRIDIYFFKVYSNIVLPSTPRPS